MADQKSPSLEERLENEQCECAAGPTCVPCLAADELRRLEDALEIRVQQSDDLRVENARLREALENILTACGDGAVWAISQCAQAALAPAKGGEEEAPPKTT